MFQITRLAASMTKVARSTVKQAAKNKIDLKNASDSFKVMHDIETKAAPYSKNIFKRAYVWTKEFFASYKVLNKGLKETLKTQKEAFGEKYTKKEAKFFKDAFIDGIKEKVNALKNELKTLTTKTKTEKTGK